MPKIQAGKLNPEIKKAFQGAAKERAAKGKPLPPLFPGADEEDDAGDMANAHSKGFFTKGVNPQHAGKLDPGAVKKTPANALSRRVDEVEVLTKEQGAAMDNQAMKKDILAKVSQSMAVAQAGQFHAMVAGIGLALMKEYCGHGEYEKEIALAFPRRTPRSLRRYRQTAEAFLEDNNLTARNAWESLSNVESGLLNRAADQLMLGDGSAPAEGALIPKKEIPKIVFLIAKHINLDGEKKKEEKEPDEPERVLTGPEQIKAAIATWDGLLAKVQTEATMRKTFGLLPLEKKEAAVTLLAGYVAMLKNEKDAAERAAKRKTGVRDDE